MADELDVKDDHHDGHEDGVDDEVRVLAFIASCQSK
jgi:hypothetical protein